MKRITMSVSLLLLMTSLAISGEPFPATPLNFSVTLDLGPVHKQSIFTVRSTPIPHSTCWDVDAIALKTKAGDFSIPKKAIADFEMCDWPVVRTGVALEIAVSGHTKKTREPISFIFPIENDGIKRRSYFNKEQKWVNEKL